MPTPPPTHDPKARHRYEVWQLLPWSSTREAREAAREGFPILIQYTPTYLGNVSSDDRPDQLLEWVFSRFNNDARPTCFSAPSLSVGDVVVLDGAAYLCAIAGWTELPAAPEYVAPRPALAPR